MKNLFTRPALMVMVLLAVFVSQHGRSAETKVEITRIIFGDHNLEAAIREAIAKPEGNIVPADLQNLRDLEVKSKGITDLTGLRYCTSLTSLDLESNNISDLTPLKQLINLTDLNLNHNQVADLTPLKDLKNLMLLRLWDNKINDVTPLAGLKNLTILNLMENHISDITPLSGLTQLEGLYLNFNRITSAAPLAKLTNLTELDLLESYIPDLTPLAGLHKLEKLDVSQNSIGDIRPLAHLTNLEELTLDFNGINDISPLASLTNLTRLNMGQNFIKSFAPLASLKKLERLHAPRNQISDISQLSGLINLTEVNLESNKITDLGPLKNLTKLSMLFLTQNNISNLEPLAGLINLKMLILSNNKIEDITPLLGLTKLNTLHIENNPLNEQAQNNITLLLNQGVVVNGQRGTKPVDYNQTQSKSIKPPGIKSAPMEFVPAGEFWMGCNEQVDTQCEQSEKPYHQVYLDAFYLDKYEVTQGEYNRCVQAGKCRDNGRTDESLIDPDLPASGVDWDQAKSFCEWVGKHLPTEAQWEKAARGTDGRKYPWGNQQVDCSLANLSGCGGRPIKVGSIPAGASPYDALDMAGNVWEWVADWHDDNYYAISPKKNPTGPSFGSNRGMRGGSWKNSPGKVRSSFRGWSYPGYPDPTFGVRCASD